MGIESFHHSRICKSRAHCDACLGDPAWRAKIAARYGMRSSEHWGCPRAGLGDLVKKGIVLVAKLFRRGPRKSCGGCAGRQAKLNALFSGAARPLQKTMKNQGA
jgi:hypothetical protein